MILKPRLIWLIIYTAIFSWLVIAVLQLFSPPEGTDVRYYVPGDTVMYIEAERTGQRWGDFLRSDDFKKLAKSRLSADYQNDDSFNDWIKTIAELDEKMVPYVNNFNRGLFGKQVGIALRPNGDGEIEAAIYTRVNHTVVGLEWIYRNFFGWWSDYEVSSTTYRNITVGRLYLPPTKKRKQMYLFYTVIDDMLVIGTSKYFARTAIDMKLDGHENSLMKNEKYLRTIKKMPEQSLFMTYMDTTRLQELADSAVKAKQIKRKKADEYLQYILPLAEDVNAESLAIGCWFDGALQVNLWFEGKPERAVDECDTNPEYLKYLSADTCTAVYFPLNIYEFFDELEFLGLEGAKNFKRDFDDIGNMFGCNFRKDVMPYFTRQTVLAVREHRAVVDSIRGEPAFSLLMKCRDSEKFNERVLRPVLKTLREKARMGLVNFEPMTPYTTSNNMRFFIYRIGALDNAQDLVLSSTFTPSFALIGDYFIVSSRYESLLAFARTYSRFAPSDYNKDNIDDYPALSETEAFRSLKKHLPANSTMAVFMKAVPAIDGYRLVQMDKIDLSSNLSPREKERERRDVLDSTEKWKFARVCGFSADYLPDGVRFHIAVMLNPMNKDKKAKKNKNP